MLIPFVLYFKNYKRWMLSLNSKHVQHVKIKLGQYLTWPFGSGELKNDEKRAITPRRVIRFTSKLQGM
jgi:hypothetical protein